MTLTARNLPAVALSALVAAVLVLFIAYPLATVLVESFVVRGPMTPERMATVTREALDTLPAGERDATVARWAATATEKERVDATAAAFGLLDIPVAWDRKAAYNVQKRNADAAVAALPPGEAGAFRETWPLAHVMLHKRAALAFKVKDALGQKKFDELRNGTERRLGIDHYLEVARKAHLRFAAFNSLVLAACAAVTTTVLAFALAYGVNYGGVRRPQFTRAVLLTPLVAPPVLIATAMLMLFGRRGLVTHSLLDQGLGLIDAEHANLYGFGGILLAQTLSFMPAAFIVFDNVMRKHDADLDEAAVNLGARPWQSFTQVTLSMNWPALKRAFMLVFILSLTDFGNPALLGRDMPVLAGVIYDQITAYQNTPLAAAICIWLLAPSLLLYLALEAVGRRKRYASGGGGRKSEIALPGVWRAGLSSLAAAVMLVILTIYATMALGAVTRVWGVDWSVTLGYFTPEGVNVGLGGSGYGSSDRGLGLVWDSLAIAGMAAPLGGLLGILVGYVIEKLRPPGADLIFFIAIAPAIVPGIIFGIGYIVAFNFPFGIRELALTGTSAILVINILFSNLFVGVLAARAALQGLDPAVDEAAESLGAGLASRFFGVTLPMLKPALLLGTLYVFIDGLTTLSSVIFLVSGNHKLASVAIFNHAASGDFGYAGAKSLVLLALALAAIALIRLIEQQPRYARQWKRMTRTLAARSRGFTAQAENTP